MSDPEKYEAWRAHIRGFRDGVNSSGQRASHTKSDKAHIRHAYSLGYNAGRVALNGASQDFRDAYEMGVPEILRKAATEPAEDT
jgi:hypothetical protein